MNIEYKSTLDFMQAVNIFSNTKADNSRGYEITNVVMSAEQIILQTPTEYFPHNMAEIKTSTELTGMLHISPNANWNELYSFRNNELGICSYPDNDPEIITSRFDSQLVSCNGDSGSVPYMSIRGTIIPLGPLSYGDVNSKIKSSNIHAACFKKVNFALLYNKAGIDSTSTNEGFIKGWEFKREKAKGCTKTCTNCCTIF